MILGWRGTRVRTLRTIHTTRAKSTSTSSSKKPGKVLPYSPLSQNRQQRAQDSSANQNASESGNSSPQYESLYVLIPKWTFIVVNLFFVAHMTTKYVFTIRSTLGPSMLPTINYQGDWVLLSKVHANMGWFGVGDLISFKQPMHAGEYSIKRVIAMPGDFVLRDTPGKGDGTMVRVPQGHCWVTGDNLEASRDSRMFGALPLALVRAKILCRIWPNPTFFRNGLTDMHDADDDKD